MSSLVSPLPAYSFPRDVPSDPRTSSVNGLDPRQFCWVLPSPPLCHSQVPGERKGSLLPLKVSGPSAPTPLEISFLSVFP